jgi:predicted phage-related endonuclease
MLSKSVMDRARAHRNRDAWLRDRRNFIGGSDAPALFGASRYSSEYAVWAEKKLGVAPVLSGEWLEWGNYLEGAIARGYADREKRTVHDLGAWTILVHENGVTAATLDFVLGDDGRGPGVLQIKNFGVGAAKAFHDGLPLDYELQIQQEMLVSGCRWGVLAVLVGGNKLRAFERAADDELHTIMLETEADWWSRYVQGDEQPAVDDGSERTIETLRLVWRNVEPAKTIVLPSRFAALWSERQRIVRELARLEEQARVIEAQFMRELGAAEYGIIPGVGRIARSARADGSRVWTWPKAADPNGAAEMIQSLTG